MNFWKPAEPPTINSGPIEELDCPPFNFPVVNCGETYNYIINGADIMNPTLGSTVKMIDEIAKAINHRRVCPDRKKIWTDMKRWMALKKFFAARNILKHNLPLIQVDNSQFLGLIQNILKIKPDQTKFKMPDRIEDMNTILKFLRERREEQSNAIAKNDPYTPEEYTIAAIKYIITALQKLNGLKCVLESIGVDVKEKIFQNARRIAIFLYRKDINRKNEVALLKEVALMIKNIWREDKVTLIYNEVRRAFVSFGELATDTKRETLIRNLNSE